MIGQLPETCGEKSSEHRCGQTQSILLRRAPACSSARPSRCSAWWNATCFNHDIPLRLRETCEDGPISSFGCGQERIARIVYLSSQNVELACTTHPRSTAKFRLIALSFQGFEQGFLCAYIKDCTCFLDSDLPDHCA